MNLNISFVIPVYNSENTIGKVINEIINLYGKTNCIEIILVNDYSKDNSNKVCEEWCKRDIRVKLITLAKNFGQHGAIMAGLNQVTGDYIILLDDDMQNPPSEVQYLINELEQKNIDVVFGAREEYNQSLIRRLYSKANRVTFELLLNLDKDLELSNFLVMRKYVVDEIIKYNGPYPFIQGLILRTTKNLRHVYTKHSKRVIGESNYTLTKLLKLWLNGFTSFSIKPLRLATITGAFFAILGFIFAIFLVVKRILNPNLAIGWTSLMVTVIFFSGIQLISVGMLGEYIGRVFLYQNKSPQFVIKDSLNILINEGKK